jgi:hypothetical protein
MSTVQEIAAAIPRLPREDLERLREWIDNYLDDGLELTEEVKARRDESRRDLEAGRFTTRQPE